MCEVLLSPRTFLAAASAAIGLLGADAPPAKAASILDSHVHVWDLSQFRLPWLEGAPPTIKKSYSSSDYLKDIEGLNIDRAIYVEVEVDPTQREAEADFAASLTRHSPFVGAVIGGDPGDAGFRAYLDRVKDNPSIRGVRFPLPTGASSNNQFIAGIQLLGQRQLCFDLLTGEAGLAEAEKVAAACAETQFVLDHCGNPHAPFFRSDAREQADRQHRDSWKKGIESISQRKNVACKISGVLESAPSRSAAGDGAAAAVTFCLDAFGPDRVMFGSNAPVCNRSTNVREWVTLLKEIVSKRSKEDNAKLFRANAEQIYRIT